MTESELEHLRIHLTQIGASLIQQIDSEGIIRSRDPVNAVVPDIVASHHLIDFLARLDVGIFSYFINAMLSWMMEPGHGVRDSPFAADSFSIVAGVSEEHTRYLREEITSSQLADGSFTKYTGHLRGGDFFSTLWCCRILMNYSSEIFEHELSAAVRYLLNRRNVAATDISQLGFLLYILLRHTPTEHRQVIEEISRSILEYLSENPPENASPLEFLNRLFVIEDLLHTVPDLAREDYDEVIERELRDLFELDGEPSHLPKSIERLRENSVESLFYEILIRASVVGLLYFDSKNTGVDLALDLNSVIQSNFKRVQYQALAAEAELKRFLSKYGGIHKEFEKYNEQLETIWEKTPFEKSVFIMMPFRNTLNFNMLAAKIKEACATQGLTAIRVDDPHRGFSKTLWDNLIINMLSCKYAISVYVTDQVVDKVQEYVKSFQNPNVALEFGFFVSRGQDVLILKDQKSQLPSDLQGFLWKEFDIENVDKTILSPVTEWLQHLEE